MSDGPSDTQIAVLRFIVQHQQDRGFPPSIREICAQFGWASSGAAAYHLARLTSLRLVAKGVARGFRTLQVTPAGQELLSARPAA